MTLTSSWRSTVGECYFFLVRFTLRMLFREMKCHLYDVVFFHFFCRLVCIRFRNNWAVDHHGKWSERVYKAPAYPRFACGSGSVLDRQLVDWLVINENNLHIYQVCTYTLSCFVEKNKTTFQWLIQFCNNKWDVEDNKFQYIWLHHAMLGRLLRPD